MVLPVKVQQTTAQQEVLAMRSAIRIDELPDSLRKLKVLGRGKTSIVLEVDKDWVLVVTRDHTKVEWLARYFGINLGEEIHSIEGFKVKIPSLRDVSIRVVKMPRLYPLSKANRKKIEQEIRQLQLAMNEAEVQVRKEKISKSYVEDRIIQVLNDIYQEKYPNSIFIDLFQFLSNYEAKTFALDPHMQNFMQNAEGEIILTDPIISKEILPYIMGNL